MCTRDAEPYVMDNSSSLVLARPEMVTGSCGPGGIRKDRYITIHILPDNVLLGIFEYHRLDAMQHSSLEH